MIQTTTVLGKSYPKIDGLPKVTGQALYAGDIRLPGQLAVKMLRSPHAHAEITRIDTGRAKRFPGVKCVVTYKDVPRGQHGGGTNIPSGYTDMRILDKRVRFVGDGVAAVAAVDDEVAQEALGLIEVEYNILPSVFDAVEAAQDGAPQLHEDCSRNICKEILAEMGSIAAGEAESDVIVEETFRTATQQHTPIETFSCVAFPDYEGRVNVTTCYQSPFGMRLQVASALEIPVGKVTVQHTGHIGGAFGGRQEAYQKETICAFLAMRLGKPVSMRFTREEEFHCAVVRHASTITLRLGAKKDGAFTFMDAGIFNDTGAYSSDGPAVSAAMTNDIRSLYRIPNQRIDTRCIYTNKPISGAFRGYGNPQACFALESLIERLAERLGMDSLALRRMNAVDVGDPNYVGGGAPFSSCGIRECIDTGAAAIGWASRKQRSGPDPARPHILHGTGMACLLHISGTGGSGRKAENTAVNIKANEDGSVLVDTGFTDMGQGTTTLFVQAAAETLGLPCDMVKTTTGVNTDISPFDKGSYASRGTFVVGNAVVIAAQKLRDDFLRHAAAMLNADAQSLCIKQGNIYVAGEDVPRLSLGDIVRHYEYSMDETRVFTHSVSYMPEHNSPSFAAQFAEVEVDTKTGKVGVRRIVAVHDVGKAINPMLLEGQMEGAVMQGIGYGLTEKLIFNREGHVMNNTFADYKVPHSADVPEIDVRLVETNDPFGPYGAKSIAESGLVGIAPAIRNAVLDATGVEINEIPLMPESVLKVLRQADRA